MKRGVGGLSNQGGCLACLMCQHVVVVVVVVVIIIIIIIIITNVRSHFGSKACLRALLEKVGFGVCSPIPLPKDLQPEQLEDGRTLSDWHIPPHMSVYPRTNIYIHT